MEQHEDEVEIVEPEEGVGGEKGKGKGKARGRVTVNTKTRFCWQQEDVNALILVLQEVVVSGLKVDAGSFKSGTYKLIKSKLGKHMTAERVALISGENIRNKIRALKDKYMACSEMCKRSGFGWNEQQMCVEVDSEDVAETWVKQNPVHKYKIGERFPEYYALQEIFGKDHATGVRRINTQLAYEEEVQRSKAAPTEATTGGTTTGSNFGVNNESGNGNEAGASEAVVKGKKKMKDSDVMMDFVTSMNVSSEVEKEDMAKFFEMMARRKRVLLPGECAKVEEELHRLGVPDDVVADAIFSLTERPHYIDTFWECRESKRVRFAEKLAKM